MESFLTHAGYSALIVFAFFEACSIPFISAEITFGFAGYLVYEGHLNLALVIILGTLAELAGSFVSYGLGRKGGRHAAERIAGKLLITGRDIDRAERFFSGRGAWTVTVARLIPVVRSITGLVAGFLEVPVLQFGIFNLLGTAVWATAFSVLGYEVGSDWSRLSHKISAGGYVLVLLIVIVLAAGIVHRWRQVARERAAAAVSSAAMDSAAPVPAPVVPAAPHSHRRHNGG